ncbi:hypothetical protein GCM10009655_12520 [Rhodoglobus aureus]|uniref:Uncharacterized protein n=1 Tax=Rhodoglobus aureus TaxID=191497 RepID=A0ABN1VP61_9MICO
MAVEHASPDDDARAGYVLHNGELARQPGTVSTSFIGVGHPGYAGSVQASTGDRAAPILRNVAQAQ